MHADNGFSKVNAAAAKPKRNTQVSKMMAGATANYFAQQMLLADTNGNNALEGNEINQKLQRIMHIIDANEDGILSFAELANMQQAIREFETDDGFGGNGG